MWTARRSTTTRRCRSSAVTRERTDTQRVAVLVVTSDRGMAGAYSATILRESEKLLTQLVEELTADRAVQRIGEAVSVLVEELYDNGEIVGRSAHQGPDVDGSTVLRWPSGRPGPAVGDLVTARVTDAYGVDLVAEPT